jgi:hypothetical protein
VRDPLTHFTLYLEINNFPFKISAGNYVVIKKIYHPHIILLLTLFVIILLQINHRGQGNRNKGLVPTGTDVTLLLVPEETADGYKRLMRALI